MLLSLLDLLKSDGDDEEEACCTMRLMEHAWASVLSINDTLEGRITMLWVSSDG